MALADEVQQIVPLVYEAALDPALWPRVLERMIGLLDGHCGSFICRRPDGSGAQSIEIGFDPKALEEFFGYYAQHNVLLQRGRHQVAGAIVSDQDILPKEEFRRTTYYNDFLLKQENTNAVLTAFLWRDPEKFVVFNCNRAPGLDEYGEAEKERLRPLLPHLARAFDIALRLDSFRGGGAGHFGMLESAAQGVMVLSETGRILYANATAERLLAEGDGIAADADGLRAATPTRTAALRAALARAAGGGDGATIALARIRRGRPLYAVTQPLPVATSWLQPERRRILLLLHDPAERPALDPRLLRSLFDLTAAETRLALRLYEGDDLGQAAGGLGISRHTARTQLNAVLRKTGSPRQVELIRHLTALAGLPSWPRS